MKTLGQIVRVGLMALVAGGAILIGGHPIWGDEVKYDNWGETFNEWVGPERIRAAKETQKPERKP